MHTKEKKRFRLKFHLISHNITKHIVALNRLIGFIKKKFYRIGTQRHILTQ